jgi:hypothetical protein
MVSCPHFPQDETDGSLCRLGNDNRHARQPQRSFVDQEGGYCQAGRSIQWIQPCCRTAQVRVDFSVLYCFFTLSQLKTYIACMIYAFNATRLMPLYQISDQRNQNLTRTRTLATSLTVIITRKPLFTLYDLAHNDKRRRSANSIDFGNDHTIPRLASHPPPISGTTAVPYPSYRLHPPPQGIPRCRSWCPRRDRKITRTS